MSGNKPVKLILLLTIVSFFEATISKTIDAKIPAEHLAQLYPGSKDEIPDYDIVPIHPSRIQKREADQKTHFHIKAFGEHIKLWLNPIDGVLASIETPVRSIFPDYAYVDHLHIMPDILVSLYEDFSQSTSLAINDTPDGNSIVHGVIGAHDIYIRPIPDNYVHYAERHRRSLEEASELDFDNRTTYHIAFKLPQTKKYPTNPETQLRSTSRSKRSTYPDTLYIETMVIMDYPLFAKFEFDIQKAVEYIVLYWNGVDMKYRSIENPKFRLNIASIMIAGNDHSLSYMQNWFWRPQINEKDLAINEALSNMQIWLFEFTKIHYPNFDAAVTMTSDIFCTIVDKEKTKCLRGTDGVAFHAQICAGISEREYDKLFYTVYPRTSIVHDDAAFESIGPTAHELGHLLGALHDEDLNCTENSGIMSSATQPGSNMSDWSACTLKEFEWLLEEGGMTCLYNKPRVKTVLPAFLPGRTMDANKQCFRLQGTKAVVIDDRICRALPCVSKYDRFANKTYYNGAAEGTSCGVGKLCIHGECIFEADVHW